MEYKFLGQVNSPDDLKKLTIEQTEMLAAEIRDFMVQNVSKTGGHLASSLGAVDLTLALYRVFNLPSDKVIWDVGHQAYCHKIVTGRRDSFHTLRQKDGISGFLKPDESPYDSFAAGHTSTSISAAAGFAKARDIKSENHDIIAVLGDASLANGMSLEAINHIGHDKTDMLIVVIDNEMSISPSVGALSGYLTNIMTGKIYNNLRSTAKNVLDKMSGIGSAAANIMKHMEEGVKGILSPGIIFEELGLRFFGPIDGHNIKNLEQVLMKIKDLEGPKLLHVITKKGKGYAPAEKDPTKFHGIGKFDPSTGEAAGSSSGAAAYSCVFSAALEKAAEKNSSLIAIVAAMIEGTNLSGFKEKYPARFFDVGIAEEHAVTFAAGLASRGLRPVVAIYSTFLQRSVDQIIHDVCMQKLPVIFVLDRSGLVGEDGPTHHGVFDIAFMRMTPNMTVMCPSDASELDKMVHFASDNPEIGTISIRFPRGRSCVIAPESGEIELGISRLIKKGKTLTVLNLGHLLPQVLDAAAMLEKANKEISVEIIDARFAKPFDEKALLKSVKKTGRLLTVEEGCIEGGFGQAVCAFAAASGVKKGLKTRVCAVPDNFIEQGTMEELRTIAGLDAPGLMRAMKEICRGR